MSLPGGGASAGQEADLYRIAADTGLGLRELLALRWEDVNLELR